ncbi:MAG: indolepyruvate ferredoxin oxidoreductase subunit alpha [Clostridiales bacterium GWF2_38_85]|nr:MAG: indolepyruvate ferredoxin oxidoreductase subunit alpha [Clostridiales bacterium GWF2_38_85]HBL84110.1 indolepyruvate ferredoxin oxidoreductase subunit alpha [Clostridiales bacterium]
MQIEKNQKLLLGNAAIARGLYEAGCVFVSSYPGTPSTEITEEAAKYDEIYAEWATNEKVAYEAALGAAIAGGRAFTGMKHVGLNVAADPLFTSSYTGVNAGLVVAVADDPAMHSSQNEQDSRHYAVAAKLPMLEPSDSTECLEFIKLAYNISEKFDTPVMLRLTTRISHSQGLVTLANRQELPLKEYIKNDSKYVMKPANATKRHPVVEQRQSDIEEYANTSTLNRIEFNDKKIGIISAGDSYVYAKEAFGTSVSYLKLGMVNPLPLKLIKKFTDQVDKIYVIEELDSIIESFCKANGVNVEGKNMLPVIGEYSQQLLNKNLLSKENDYNELKINIPVRPPVMCAGCPHRGTFYVLKKLGLTVIGDIGCYTLGSTIDTTVCMGASVSMLHGFNKVRPESADKRVGVIGDSTFMHSGITGLVDIIYNNSYSTLLILDNSITGMTGHQQNPCTGLTLKNLPAKAVSLETLCKACGVENIQTVDPNEVDTFEKILKSELTKDAPSVIILKRPCALLKTVKKDSYARVDADKCKSCRACMKIGCPRISFETKKAVIDESLCIGCGLCTRMCKFDAIEIISRASN